KTASQEKCSIIHTVDGYASICPRAAPEILTVCARPYSWRGTQRALSEALAGNIADSNAPTKKRRLKRRTIAPCPSGVSAVKRENPTHDHASTFRPLQRSAAMPPGY